MRRFHIGFSYHRVDDMYCVSSDTPSDLASLDMELFLGVTRSLYTRSRVLR